MDTFQTLDLAPRAQEISAPVSTQSDALPWKELTTIPSKTAILGKQAPVLNCDVFVTIDWTKDGVLISSALFDEDGYGRTYDDALEDFLVSLKDKGASLARREATLSPADRRVLAALRSSINLAA